MASRPEFHEINKMRVQQLIEGEHITKRIDPIKQYFDSLDYKGTSQFEKVAECFEFADKQTAELFPVLLLKHMARAVKMQYQNKEVCRHLFLLQSEEQQIGKSHFIRMLNPFNGDYFTEAHPTGTKDDIVGMNQLFIWNIDEYDKLNLKEVGQTKALISGNGGTARPAYGRYLKKYTRRCSFWATANPKEVLRDTTNTRYMIFKILSIQTKKLFQKVMVPEIIDQLWAEAKAMADAYNIHELELNDIEKAWQTQSNEKARLIDTIEEAVSALFEYDQAGTSTFEIQQIIHNTKLGIRSEPRGLARAMEVLKFVQTTVRTSGSQIRGYSVKLKEEYKNDLSY